MLRHVIFLLFLYGINSSSSSSPQVQTTNSKDVTRNGINKNEVGANGVENNSEEILKNFRNPVLEYLLHRNSDRMAGPPKNGIIREIRHSQTLLVPNFPAGFPQIPVSMLNQLPALQAVLASLMMPAVGMTGETSGKTPLRSTRRMPKPDTQNAFPVEFQRSRVGQQRQGASPPVPWPFANYFPIVINDPFLSVYNALTTSMYNAVSSMVEYGPEADICSKHTDNQAQKKEIESDSIENDQVEEKVYSYRQRQSNPFVDRYRKNDDIKQDPNYFDEIKGTGNSESVNKNPFKVETEMDNLRKLDSGNSRKIPHSRKRRDTTSIFLKTKQGDKIDITLEEPSTGANLMSGSHDERARSFGPALVNPPPLSTVLKPPYSESRQFLGYADKKRKSKPSKPIKEESSSEEMLEENEEETTSHGSESTNEAVAISPPPEGASVAEAKPIGLAIAGPGGVAASKPQGTAVAGPGGLAIARPVGTAIAGVEVEGSVPIGGANKNKKKPKQEQEQTDSELHYVGGLTGPIGNPQPKEFADGVYYKSVRETEGNNIQDNLFFRGRHSNNGFQLKLGQQDGRYGFIPMFSSPVQGSERLQKRMDSPTFFHGFLGNNAQGNNDHIQNYQMQY